MNSAATMGAPSSTMVPAVRADSRSGGLPTGLWAFTSAVSRPSSPTTMEAAVSSDCEKKKFVSIVKKPRKKMTKASRRARSSSVLSASSRVVRVTPASRPSTVLWVSRVPAMAASSMPSSHQRPGRGRVCQASQPRHSRHPPASAVAHSGSTLSCGSITQPTTSSRKRVSRLSRGRAFISWRTRVVQGVVGAEGFVVVTIGPVPPGSVAGGPCHGRAPRGARRAGAGRSPGRVCRPAAPRRTAATGGHPCR